MPPLQFALTVVRPVTDELRSTVHVPPATVEQLFAASVPGPETIETLIVAPAGAFTKPNPSPLSKVRWAVNVCVVPIWFAACGGVRSRLAFVQRLTTLGERVDRSSLPSAVRWLPRY